MGRKLRKTEHQDDEAKASVFVTSSSDDDEANEDLSLKIVQKAILMRAFNPVNDDVLDGTRGITASKADCEEIKTERKKKMKTRKKKNVESVYQSSSAVIVEEEKPAEIIKGTEEKGSAEAVSDQIIDNVVLRKLLRGPRYFDPPADNGWGACYNCGEEGHTAVNCTAAKRKKPCFVCGSLGHTVRECTEARDCFICKKGGHRAKDCPEKHKGGSIRSTMCLKCGNSGHEMFSCKTDYYRDDLKEIQCYVCKKFGHLCCVNTTDATPGEISCYKCGQLGHTGLACSRLRAENTDAATPSSCYKCGEQGHFARECFNSVKACSRLGTEITDAATPNSCYKCGEEGHFARECSSSVKVSKRKRELSSTETPRSQKGNGYVGYRSAPHDMGKTWRKKASLTEERDITTPWKSKHRGGWMTEHPGEYSSSKSNWNGWRSPVTSSTKSTKSHYFSSSNGSHTPTYKSFKTRRVNDRAPNLQGPASASHNRIPASRFDNYGSDRLGRRYNWW